MGWVFSIFIVCLEYYLVLLLLVLGYKLGGLVVVVLVLKWFGGS